MLFPNLSGQYYSEADRGVLSQMENFYNDNITPNQSYWGEADTDSRFEAGDQAWWNDVYGNVPSVHRRQFTFNHCRPITNVVSGYQRRNRKSTIVVPIENGDSQTADQFTKIFAHANKQEGIYETISEAFHGAIVSGMNLLQVWMDYRNDPISGEIKVNNCSYNSFLIDSYFKKADLSDCNGLWKRSYLTRAECLSLLPDRTEEIMTLSGNNSKDGKFQFMPENYNFDVQNLFTYDEFYYRSYRTQTLLADTKTGESMEWKMDDDEKLKLYLHKFPEVTVLEQQIPTVRLAIVIQGRVLYNGPNPQGLDVYPFVPVFAYYRPHLPYFPWKIQGIVRGLRDPQFLYNHRKRIEFDSLESQVTVGWKYKENALVNPKDIFLSGQGRGLALKQEADMTDVEQIAPIPVAPTTIQLSELLRKEFPAISGANEEVLGSAVDDKAGVLAMLRQGAGLTTLQGLFDQLDFSQKLLGKIMLTLVQNNFTPGKVKRIIEEEPQPQFYNKAFGKYDAAIEEGVNTTTQRQMNFAQLVELRGLDIPIPDEIMLEATTVQNKAKLMETIQKQNEEKQQLEQIKAQSELKEQEARIKLAESRSYADQGLGIERISRVEENKATAVEKRAEAVKDRELGALHLVRALKEIETIDLGQIEKLLELSRILKAEEANVQAEIESKPIQTPQIVQPQQQDSGMNTPL